MNYCWVQARDGVASSFGVLLLRALDHCCRQIDYCYYLVDEAAAVVAVVVVVVASSFEEGVEIRRLLQEVQPRAVEASCPLLKDDYFDYSAAAAAAC